MQSVTSEFLPLKGVVDLCDEADCCQSRAHVSEEVLTRASEIGVASPASICPKTLQSCWQVGHLFTDRSDQLSVSHSSTHAHPHTSVNKRTVAYKQMHKDAAGRHSGIDRPSDRGTALTQTWSLYIPAHKILHQVIGKEPAHRYS